MLKNYLIMTLRVLRKNKIYSIITILGLSIGLASSMLMLVFAYYEFSFDKFNEKSDRIYRMGKQISSPDGEIREPLSSAPTAQVLKTYPEVADVARFKNIGKVIVKKGDELFYEDNVYYGDPSVFTIFTLPMTEGSPSKALINPYSIVITREMAEKYFGNEKPLGKILTLDNKNDFIVTGVIKNLPENTHRKINMLCSFETLISQKQPDLEDWMSFDCSTYILLHKNADYKKLESRFAPLIQNYMSEDVKKLHGKLSFYILPLEKLHLYSHLDGFSPGLITRVISFCSMALFITLIACINFVNLSTARSSIRVKEISMRKVIGAGRIRLIKQFLAESVIISLLALLFAFILVEIFLPAFRNKVESRLLLTPGQNFEIFCGFLLLAIVIGLISGIYPAFYLSKIKPVQSLKGNLTTNRKSRMRSILVVIQFALSIILICHTFNTNYQLDYLNKKDIGFNKKNIIVLPVTDIKVRESIQAFKTALLENPDIINVTAASSLPGFGIPKSVKVPEGYSQNEVKLMDEINVDADFISTLGIKLKMGRDFIKGSKADQQNSIIINELAVRKFKWKNPIGKTIQFRTGADKYATATVIGVVKDFNLSSLYRAIEPLFISNNNENIDHILIRVQPDKIQGSVKYIIGKWKTIYPDHPFQYSFLDTGYDFFFRIFEKIIDVLTIFTFLAILLACLGIFALSAFISERRTKEIGIRKVLGDTAIGIVFRLNFELMKYVLIALVLVIPYIYLSKNFLKMMMPYTAEPNYILFIEAAALIFLVALLSISFQAIKASLANPVESLKYE